MADSGIYIIRNLNNGKFYIGSSKNTTLRWRKHRSELRGGCHGNSMLQRAWTKHGEDGFVFEMLEAVGPELLLEREQHFIDLMDPVANGYNICPVAGTPVAQSSVTRTHQNKSELILLAKSGASKPLRNVHPLADVLRGYTDKERYAYDAVFDAKIRKLAPSWFVKTKDKKAVLLRMAEREENRPINRKHPLGRALCSYTLISEGSYDPEFSRKIRQLAPHWFRKEERGNSSF